MSKRLDTAKIGTALHRAAGKAVSGSRDARAGRFIDPSTKPRRTATLKQNRRSVRDSGSSAVAEISYDDATQCMRVIFTSGGIYLFEGVPSAVYDAFAAAPSLGAYFQAHIRDKYAYREL